MRWLSLALLPVLIGCATTLSRSELAVEYYNLGSAYVDLGQLEKGASFLARAVDLDPSLARASYNLARAYVLLHEHDRAVALLLDLLTEDPENTLVMEALAYTEYSRGRADIAASWYDRVLEADPGNVTALQNRAVIAEMEGRSDLAIQLLERARQLAPANRAIVRRIIDASVAVGDFVRARGAAADLLAVEDDPAVRLRYAELLERDEYFAAALEQYERVAVARQAESVLTARARFGQARILLTAAEEPELGIERLEEALGLGFSDRDALGALLEHEGLVERERVRRLLAASMADGSEEPGELTGQPE